MLLQMTCWICSACLRVALDVCNRTRIGQEAVIFRLKINLLQVCMSACDVCSLCSVHTTAAYIEKKIQAKNKNMKLRNECVQPFKVYKMGDSRTIIIVVAIVITTSNYKI